MYTCSENAEKEREVGTPYRQVGRPVPGSTPSPCHIPGHVFRPGGSLWLLASFRICVRWYWAAGGGVGRGGSVAGSDGGCGGIGGYGG